MSSQEQVPESRHPQVGLGFASRADQVGFAEHVYDRRVLLAKPAFRHVLARHELRAALHGAEAPRLDTLRELGVAPFVAQLDPIAELRWKRHALEEEPLMALEREIAKPGALVGAHRRHDLGDVGVDGVQSHRPRHGNAVVAVADEVQVADPVDVDRRHGLPAPDCLCDAFPSTPDPSRSRPEAAVEIAGSIHRADDRVERYDLEPEARLTSPAERLDDLVEREDYVDVVGLAPKAPGQT